jgi:hypothetical protein
LLGAGLRILRKLRMTHTLIGPGTYGTLHLLTFANYTAAGRRESLDSRSDVSNRAS